jgi:mono/diheme cytochrome c family protein
MTHPQLSAPSRILAAAALLLTAGLATAQSTPKVDASRGELLYSTHCVSCHTTQMHWRDKRLAKDWTGLKAQVRRWQSNIGVNWNNDDVAEVARYLNGLYYHYPQTTDQVGSLDAATHRLARLRSPG